MQKKKRSEDNFEEISLKEKNTENRAGGKSELCRLNKKNKCV